MKIIVPNDPGALYAELMAQYLKRTEGAEGGSDRVILQFGDKDLQPMQALAIHDILVMFSDKLDITAECLFDINMFTWCALAPLARERRQSLTSVGVSFCPFNAMLAGDVTHMLITGEHIAGIEDRVVSIIANETDMDPTQIRDFMVHRRVLSGQALFDANLFGGPVHV